MTDNEFVWIASIIMGLTLLGWLVIEWLESAQPWDAYDVDATPYAATHMGRGEQQTLDTLEVEMELLRCYPLDPFAPALLWRPLHQEEWTTAPEAINDAPAHPPSTRPPTGPTPALQPGQAKP